MMNSGRNQRNDHYQQIISEFEQDEGDKLDRVEFMVIDEDERFSDLHVVLGNKTLKLFKSIFLFSSNHNIIANCEGSAHVTITDLKDRLLNVEERLIVDFIMLPSQYHRCDFADLLDYYIFFKEIGMMWIAIEIVEFCHQKIKSSKEIYEIFRDSCQRFEKKGLDKWFSPENCEWDHFISVHSFSNVFTMMLFCKMLERLNDFSNNFDLRFLPYMENILGHMKEQFGHFKNNFREHADFLYQKTFLAKDCKAPISRSTLFQQLRKGKLYNMILRASDGKLFNVHKELLVLKMKFFFHMFHFNGKESEDLKEKGFVVLERLNSDTCSLMLDFIYYDEISVTERRFDVLLDAVFFAEMYMEKEFYDMLIRTMQQLPPVTDRVVHLEKKLYYSGWKIMTIERLRRDIVPILGNLRRGDPWDPRSHQYQPRTMNLWNREFLMMMFRESERQYKMKMRFVGIHRKKMGTLFTEIKKLRAEKDVLMKRVEEYESARNNLDDDDDEESILGNAVKRKRSMSDTSGDESCKDEDEVVVDSTEVEESKRKRRKISKNLVSSNNIYAEKKENVNVFYLE